MASDSEQSLIIDTDDYTSSPPALTPLFSSSRGEIITTRGSETSNEEDVECVLKACAGNLVTEYNHDETWVSSASGEGSPCPTSGEGSSCTTSGEGSPRPENRRGEEWRQAIEYFEARRLSARKKKLLVKWTPSANDSRKVRNHLTDLKKN